MRGTRLLPRVQASLTISETHARLGLIIADAERSLAALAARERLARRIARRTRA